MYFRLSYIILILGLTMIFSCSKENIDEITMEEEEVEVEVVSCDLSLEINGAWNPGNYFLTAVADGGVAPYSYEWSTGETTQSINILSDGDYVLEVTDAEGCTIVETTSVELSSNPCLDFTAMIQNGPTAYQLTVLPTGGTPPYAYLWSTGETTQTIMADVAGEYSITITDSNACTTTTSFTQESLDCAQFNGAVMYYPAAAHMFVNIVGGTAPFTYTWSTGETTAEIGVIEDGIYTVTVTDSEGCELIASYEVDNSSPCNSFMGSIAFDSLSNSITVSVFGGTAPYTYEWSTGATSSTIQNPEDGNYSIHITDSEGCIIFLIINIGEPDPCIGFDMEFSYDSVNQQLTAIPLGGTPPYNFGWSTVENTQTISVESGTGYNSSIMDAEGCFAGGIFFVP